MDFIPINVLKSSNEFDNIFELTTRSTKINDCYTNYVWAAPLPFFFRHCDYGKVFPLAINLYLKTCSQEEFETLRDKKYFLRIQMYYHDNDCKISCIAIQNLNITSLNDLKYQTLLLSCPPDMIPVTIDMGPIWHYVGINRWMYEQRHIDSGAIGMEYLNISAPTYTYIMGITMLGRDAYPSENTEEKIQEMEKREEIFIRRRQKNTDLQ